MWNGQWLVLLVLLAPAVQAETWFSIHVQDLVDNIECFDPATCSPMEGVALVSPIGSEELWEFPILAYGPGGMPPSYHFVIPDGGDYPYSWGSIHRIEVPWFGPGFRYTYSESYGPFDFFYLTGIGEIPLFPNPVFPGSGCICDPPTGWEWEECDEGPIPLDQEFIVPAGVVLEIEAGTRIRAFPGALIRVEGALACRGTEEAGVVFEGNAWHGIEFAPGATGELSYTRITGVVDDWDGGALSLEPGSEVAMDHCILHHNSTSESGGGAFVDDGALLRLRSCTVSHNSAGSGGNLYVEDGGFATGLYNLVTFGTPQTMISEDGPMASNLSNSMLYPLVDPSQGTGWYCDPGYADTARGDFHLAFWTPDSTTEVNCTIDVAVIPGDTDPDGTRTDMGALPVDQHDILWPASRLAVEDRPDDHGGLVYLGFDASPNDGTELNPVSFYTVWVRYPGSDEFISSGQTMGAIGLSRYTIPVSTLRDSTASNGQNPGAFMHTFRVHTHSSRNPDQMSSSDESEGYSIGQPFLASVTGLETDMVWYCDTEAETATLGIRWNPVSPVGLASYRLYAGPTDDSGWVIQIYEGPDPFAQHCISLVHVEDETFTYFVVAFDNDGNESESVPCESPYLNCWMQVESPANPVLLAAYPNPFNPTTRVAFELPVAQQVRLALYDMNGRQAGIVFEGGCSAGRHEVVVDGSRLSSGVYFLRLETGRRVQTQKLLLLK